MVKKEQKVPNKILKSTKTVLHFLFLITLKGLRKKEEASPEKIAFDAKKQHISFIKMLYKFGINMFKKDDTSVPKVVKKKKRKPKTWARVKKDFYDYYQDLVAEFEKSANTPELPEDTGEKLEQQGTN